LISRTVVPRADAALTSSPRQHFESHSSLSFGEFGASRSLYEKQLASKILEIIGERLSSSSPISLRNIQAGLLGFERDVKKDG
jgi:hypothetical protein